MPTEESLKRRYVHSDVDRFGTRRFYFRRRGQPKVRLPDPASSDFEAAYTTALRFGATVAEIDTRPRLRVKDAKTSFVYFIRQGASVKIGYSSNPLHRVATLKTAMSEPIDVMVVVAGDRLLERRLHASLAKHRLQGEWFRNHKDIRRVMEQAARTGKINAPSLTVTHFQSHQK